MIAALVALLEQIAVAVLPAILGIFAKTFDKYGIDAAAVDYVQQSVASADANSLLATPAAKLEFVQKDVTGYFGRNWPGISASFLNALIELVVHAQHHPSA